MSLSGVAPQERWMRRCRMAPERKMERGERSHYVHWIAIAWLLVALAGSCPASRAQGIGQGMRSVQGRVLDSQDKPQPNAVVYLQNEKSLEVKTYITIGDGSYRFGQ